MEDPKGTKTPNERNSELRKRTKATIIDDVETDVGDNERKSDMIYGIEDTPPWYMTILFGFQHYLLVLGSSITPALLITPAMCIGDDDVGKSEVISTVFFVDGIATLLQTTFGTRLPIFQGGSFSFIAPALAVLSLPKWQCPAEPPSIANLTAMYGNSSMNINETLLVWRRDLWTSRQREIQGSLALASIFQMLLGFTGIIGMLLPFIGPLCIAPTIALIGLALFGFAAQYSAGHWGIAVLTMALIILFSQYLARIGVPFPAYNRDRGCHTLKYPIFQLLPLILSIVIVWCLCAILTVTNVFPSDPKVLGYAARTDIKLKVLDDAKWFRFPYPGQWGLPTYSAAAVIGLLAGSIAGLIESLGDYYACAQVSGVPPPPIHAINRGVFFEGIGIACAGMWGSTTGVTSYSQNIAAIGITKVASRRVIQVGAVIALLLGMFGKFGALFVTMPEPIFGGIFMTLFGLVAAVGVSSLQHVDLNSSRNLFIFGFCVLLGLSVPSWIGSRQEVIDTVPLFLAFVTWISQHIGTGGKDSTYKVYEEHLKESSMGKGNTSLDQVLFVLLNTPMLIGAVMGFLLDNTIPGTPEERGLVGWRGEGSSKDQHGLSSYDLPFGMGLIRRMNWLRFVPISPTYQPPSCHCSSCCQRKGKLKADANQMEGVNHTEHGLQGYDNPVMCKTSM